MKILQPGSVEYLGPWDLPITDDAQDPVDPTSFTVEIACTTGTLIEEVDWKDAEWVTDPDPAPTTYRVRSSVTFGATGSSADVELAPDDYKVWARITSAPEQPVLRLDTLDVRGPSEPAAAPSGGVINGGTP